MAFQSPTYKKAVQLQRLLHARASLESVKDATLATLCHAFCELEYLKRVMRMKPNPKPVEVQLTGRGSALIDYKALVRRPRKATVIEIPGMRSSGPPTQLSSSSYYKANGVDPLVSSAPNDTATGSGLSASSKPQEPDAQKTQ
jgi:hypothetical protein